MVLLSHEWGAWGSWGWGDRLVGGGAMGPTNRELAPRLKAAAAAGTELQERDALESVSLAAAMRG